MAQRPSILQLEQTFLAAWPASEDRWDGGWVRRASGGHTKRANCLQCMDPGDADQIAKRVSDYVAWARDRDISPILRVTPLCHPAIPEKLKALDWQAFDHSSVLTAPTGAHFDKDAQCELVDPTDAEWLQSQIAFSGYPDSRRRELSGMIAHMPKDKRGVLLRDEEGIPAASGLIVAADGVGVYFNIVVRPDLRGQGIGKRIMKCAMQALRKMGAHWSALQVVASNATAINLYRGLGFEELYQYYYMRPPAEAALPVQGAAE
ncbi:MAG: GNAT family N-acetyltransferase [Hyphomicrobiaceae bacterium]|nr:GNAT family N-acetyltransferase [Hyphomicrobiaceae bacterium]